MKPPRLASFVLRLVAPAGDRPFILADLREEFDRLASSDGRTPARRWYRRQVAASLAPLLRQRLRRVVRRRPHLSFSHSALAADLAQSLRWIRRHSVLASTVVLTLAIAFSTALAAFTLIYRVVLAPLPFDDPDKIVAVRATGATVPRTVTSTSLQNFQDWRESTRGFDALSAFATDSATLTGRGEPRPIDLVRVAPAFDRVLGIRPLGGRMFVEADYGSPDPTVAVVTAAFGTRQFGDALAALGNVLMLDDKPFEIVGVLPDTGLAFPSTSQAVWIPLVPRPGAFWEHSRGSGWTLVVGRLGHDVSLERARGELTSVVRALAERYPKTNRERTEAELSPLADRLIGPVAPVLWLIGIALGTVLLIACANVASLLLASASDRRREFAVRVAMGAPIRRLVRQLVGETVVLSGMAAAIAAAASPSLVRAFVALYPSTLPREFEPAADLSALGAACVIWVLGVVLLTLPQSLHTRHLEVRSSLAGTNRTTIGRSEHVLRFALVSGQIALSLLLIVAGIGFGRTLAHLTNVDTGYDAGGVMAFTLNPSPGSGADALQLYEAVVEAAHGIPGIREAAAGVAVPMTTSGWRFGMRPPDASADVLVAVNLTTDSYFHTLGIQLVEGRLLTPDEQRRGIGVVVVNQTFARLAGGAVIGTRFDYSGANWEIVGVVEDIRHRGPRETPTPELFIPWHNAGRRPQAMVVRADGDPLDLIPALATRIRAIDPKASMGTPARLTDRLREATGAERFRATLVATLAGIAVLLAALGAYSVTAFTVARRLREFGIRLALGERPASVRRRALTSAGAPAVTGIVAGIVSTVIAARWLESFMYQVDARDATTLTAGAAGLLVVALAAGATSARRAATLDPLVVLQEQ